MKNLPLIDLHLHLDGSLSIENIKKISSLQNIPLNFNDEEITKKLSVSEGCKNLNEYLEKFSFPNIFLQTASGIENAIKNLCDELYKKGFIYAEIRFAPQKSCEKGLSQEEIIESACRAVKESPFPCNLILCCMRGNDNYKQNIETVKLTKKYLGKGVCACDLAGAEALFDTKNFSKEFTYAKKHDIPFTIHAGEASGADSIKAAVDFGALRIGHGVRCLEDKKLCSLLFKKQIALELCPTSNINTCVFKSIEKFPLKELMLEGIPLTVNSDNMSVSKTDVKKELNLLEKTFNLTQNDIKLFLLNSARFSFAEESLKKKLTSAIEKAFF